MFPSFAQNATWEQNAQKKGNSQSIAWKVYSAKGVLD
jgi:hypothetical protein